MNGTVAELMQELQKCQRNIAAVEKKIETGARQRTDAVDMIRKGLYAGGPSNGRQPVVMGIDGADTLSMLEIGTRGRMKSLHMGQFLHTLGQGVEDKLAPAVIEKAVSRFPGCLPVRKSPLAENAGATGGYTVPVQFYADLLRMIAEASFVRSRCTNIPMMSNQLLVPALDQSAAPAFGTSAFFGGIAASWQPEGQTLNESEPTFRQVSLTARNLVFYTVASNQLLQDNAVALDTLLTTLFVEAMAWFVDFYVLRGNGAAQPLGVLNAPATYNQIRQTATSFTLQDVAKMLSHLLMSSWSNAIWIMHPSVLPQLIQMADSTNGRLVWLNQAPQTVSEGSVAVPLPMTLAGLPIYFSEKVPQLGTTGDVMLCDMSKYLIGDRLQVQIEASKEAKFLQNQIVWRIVMRWDGQPWLNAPIYLADGADTYQVSPFVRLSSATS